MKKVLTRRYFMIGGAFALFGLSLSGHLAYVAAAEQGLQIVDISGPQLPHLVGNYDSPRQAEESVSRGHYLLVADGQSGFQILDITNTSAPTAFSHYDTPGQAKGLAIDGSYAYVADTYSLLIFK